MTVKRSIRRGVTQRRRGGALFEVMLSIALFVGAAALAMATTRSMLGSLDQAHRQQQAVDLARSKMAELRAGLVNVADLQAERAVGVGTFDHFNDEPGAQPLWDVQIRTERSEFGGLSIVTLTVIENSNHPDAVRYTLRQLVQLRDVAGEEAYEMDDLLEGL